ncbi:MAG: hypothetical protein LBE49_05635 [Deltaproteobacteria bacterium]|jgi:hypothetical protein|nr:hypothetical protein [Deltaproteobacteria bacterium]
MITISFISVFLTPALCHPELRIFIQRGESLSQPESYALASLPIRNGDDLLENLFARVMNFILDFGLKEPKAISSLFWKARFWFGPDNLIRLVALPGGLSVQRHFPEPFWFDKLSLRAMSPLEGSRGGKGLLGLEGHAILEKAQELDGRESPRAEMALSSDDGLCDLGKGLHRLMAYARATWGLMGSKEIREVFPDLKITRKSRPKFEVAPKKPERKPLKITVSDLKPGQDQNPLLIKEI